MSEEQRLALVTGGNRGIGFEVCRRLAREGLQVLLGARNLERARDAASNLGDNVEPFELDVTSPESVKQASERLASGGNSLDILVNNAAISLHGFDSEVVRATLDTNVLGPLRVTNAFRPLLREPAVIVMVSSGMGTLDHVSPELGARFSKPLLTFEELQALLDEFHQGVAAGRHEANGWPSSAYSVSKVALNALTRIYARELQGRAIVNAVCPGWVRTSMGGPSAPRAPEQGAESIVSTALLDPRAALTGAFFRDGRQIEW